MKLSAFLDKLNVRFRRLFSLCFFESHLGTHAINPGGLGAKPPGSLSFFFAPSFFAPNRKRSIKILRQDGPGATISPLRDLRDLHFLLLQLMSGRSRRLSGSELCKPKRSGLGFRL